MAIGQGDKNTVISALDYVLSKYEDMMVSVLWWWWLYRRLERISRDFWLKLTCHRNFSKILVCMIDAIVCISLVAVLEAYEEHREAQTKFKQAHKALDTLQKEYTTSGLKTPNELRDRIVTLEHEHQQVLFRVTKAKERLSQEVPMSCREMSVMYRMLEMPCLRLCLG